MENDIFSLVRQKIAEAGSKDPEEVADHYGFVFVHLKGTIGGYATVYNETVPIIGLNDKMSDEWYMFGGWHELTHIFDGHIFEKGFSNNHFDGTFFAKEVDSQTVSRQERTANLVSADVNIDDDAVIDITGYNTRTMRQYRRVKAYYEELAKTYEELRCSAYAENPSTLTKVRLQDTRRKIDGTRKAILDLESDMVSMNCCRSFSEIASELGVSERILRYKLEAMRIRGFDIDRQELEDYSKMFKGVV